MELTLNFDAKAIQTINSLMMHYKAKNKAELIAKALTVLKVAAQVDTTGGELIARKGKDETKIVVK